MRPISRINRIIALIDMLWKKNPDQRLGQLLINFAFGDKHHIWNQEDDLTELILLKKLEEQK